MAVTKVVMPKLSEAMETGKVIKWLRNEGDRVQSGDIVAEIETDKADVEMEAFGAGVLRKIVVPAGERAPVGSLIGVIAEPGEDIASVLAEAGGPSPAAKAPPAVSPAPAAPVPKSVAPAAAPALRPVRPDAAGPEYEVVALTPMRAAIAKQMPLSKAPIPHFYVTSEVAMDRAWDLRQELNALDGQPKISVNDLVVRACALALTEHPYVNASFQGDAVRVYHRAHIGIAVALDDGLITPVLRNCESKPLAQIAVESRDLAERARARKLRAQELPGATFSISNLGMCA